MLVNEKNEQFKFEADMLTQKSVPNAPLAHPIIISKSYDESLASQEIVSFKQMIESTQD
jgi:hypothetical protein